METTWPLPGTWAPNLLKMIQIFLNEFPAKLLLIFCNDFFNYSFKKNLKNFPMSHQAMVKMQPVLFS